MSDQLKTEIQRINGYLKEVVTFFDASGKPISQVINPLMVELKPRDVLQLFVGAFLIAAPLCFTEEVWNLSIELHFYNTLALGLLSIIVVILFIYFNFYRNRIEGNIIEFVKRVLATYLITTSSIVLILLLINKLPFYASPEIAIKRIIVIAFPSVFGAILSDSLK